MDWGPRWCFLSYTEMLQRGELHPGPRPGRQWASATWEQSCELRGMCWTPGKQHLARAADVGFLRDFRKNVSSVPSLKCPICIFPSSSSLLRILLNSYLKCKFPDSVSSVVVGQGLALTRRRLSHPQRADTCDVCTLLPWCGFSASGLPFFLLFYAFWAYQLSSQLYLLWGDNVVLI